MLKQAMRRQLLAYRRAMEKADWLASSTDAQNRFMAIADYNRASCIAIYSPVGNEVDTAVISASAMAAGKKVLYPVVDGDNLHFLGITSPGQLKKGHFGIYEPCMEAGADLLATADIVLVPGVAFDRHGNRLGFGKGYYDRCLCQLSPSVTLVGICHDFQLADSVPAESHDIRMHLVVTGKRLIKAGTGISPD